MLAYLAPAAVTALVPGPSDLPLRYRMLTSWGSGGSEATLALAASGLFSVGIKLVLPVIAAVGLLVSDRADRPHSATDRRRRTDHRRGPRGVRLRAQLGAQDAAGCAARSTPCGVQSSD